MQNIKIIAILYLTGIITMIIFSIPVFMFFKIKAVEYITYYMFSFFVIGIIYYRILKRKYRPPITAIIIGVFLITVVFFVYYIGVGTQVAILCAFAATLSVLLTMNCIKYFYLSK